MLFIGLRTRTERFFGNILLFVIIIVVMSQGHCFVLLFINIRNINGT